MLSSAHSTLAKRLLSHGKDLPPLLATQLPSNELDAELYDFIALSLRAYVNPWWSKITRYDKEFLPEITRALVHVVRSLEARLLTMDFVSLGLLDLPTIITTHYSDYRNAADKLSTSYASGGAASLPQLFHFIQPHMAVSADGVIDQEYFRQIIDLVLKHCLPPEDYSPDAERFIVREVILKILLNDIIPKVTQPWFIQKLILDHIIREHETSSLLKPPSPPQNGHGFSFHTFVVIVLSAIQSVSGACLAIIQGYKQAISTIKRVNQSTLQAPPQRSPPQLYIVPPASQTRPSDAGSEDEFNTRHIRSGTSSTINSISSSMSHTPLPPPPPLTQTNHVVHINYTQHLIDMLSEIFSLNNRFASTALLTFCAMLATATSHFLDRYAVNGEPGFMRERYH
ncbi:hypothetical protein AX16_005538 [Volvariella volvacea WC 439]|nr:hypothetical protein AX16_005538 [Volvariella volvacea WC 439]